ncbi:MAG: hypothetical protein K9N06_01975 [Candidatus Cloacimonetes bacterium]|nr:hypothetical protein [Candidatus Cloacimonadota bacterium]
MKKGLFFFIFFCFCCSLAAVSNLSLDDVKVNIVAAAIGSTISDELESITNKFSFTVRWSNARDDAPAHMNSMSISFPNFTSSTYLSKVRNSSRAGSKVLDNGEFLGTEGGGVIFADFVTSKVVDNNILHGEVDAKDK